MTSLKMWCLLPLTVLLIMSITPTMTEMVDSMSECKEFFLEKTPPRIKSILAKGKIQNKSRYKVICQTYKDEKRFVTLYDTTNKIPVFSAYKYRGEGDSKEDKRRPPNPDWNIEPQLEDMKNDKNMENCDDTKTYTNQASNSDYKNNNDYNRGHLFPSSYAFNEIDKISTFTLTNIVPQAISFNSGSWEKMEECVKSILEKYCENKEGYVVTGAKPSHDKKLNNRVNIPSVLWSAFCCYNQDKKKWIAGAHWGENTAEDLNSKHLHMKTLEELEKQLNIAAFPGNCPVKETVTTFYPEIINTGTCKPPQLPLIPKPAPSTTTNQQQFIDFLNSSKKFHSICKKVLNKSVTITGPQSKNLWNLCLKKKKQQIRSEDIDEPFKKFLLELLNNSDS